MKKAAYILLAFASLLVGCHKAEIVEPVLAPVDKDIKVPMTVNVMIPNDGPSTRSMADDPQITNIVIAVFGNSGYFNEWVKASVGTGYATKNYDGTPATVYPVTFNLTVSESRLRVHFIANCPHDMVNNPPITGVSSQDLENVIMSKIRSKIGESSNDGYWAKIILPYGVQIQYKKNPNNDEYVPAKDENENYIPTELTKSQIEKYNPAGIPFIRNFARVYLQNGTDGAWIIDKFALAYAPAEGPIAPILPAVYTADMWGDYLQIPEGDETTEFYPEAFFIKYSEKTTLEELVQDPYNYVGYSPANLALGTYPADDSGMADWVDANDDGLSDSPLYIYERAKPRTGQKATRIIIKAHRRGEAASTAKYFPLDIVDHETGENMAFLRNFTYTVTLGGIAGDGNNSISEAAVATSANVSADPKTADLTEVSDGVASIGVSYIDATYITSGEYELMFNFVPNVNSTTNPREDNSQVSLKVGYDNGSGFIEGATSANGSAFSASGQPVIETSGGNPVLYVRSGNNFVVATADNGLNDPDVTKWGKIKYTTTETVGEAFSQSYHQTIRVIGTYGDSDNPTSIYRDVLINLTPKKVLTVECLDKYIDEVAGKTERVRVYIPGDLTRSMFPLQFKVEPKEQSLNPELDQDMPVASGTSLSGSGSTFYFIRTLTRDEYEALPSVSASDSRKYFDCTFKSIVDHSASVVYVGNDYFTTASDEFFNYTQRFFTDLRFSSTRTRAVGDEVYFSFKMDVAHAGRTAVLSHDGTNTENPNILSGDYRVIPRVVTITLKGLAPQRNSDGTLVDQNVRYISSTVLEYYPTLTNQIINQGPELSLVATAEDYSVTLSTDRLPSVKTLYAEASKTSPRVTSISITPSNPSVRVGRTISMEADIRGDDIDGTTATWSISPQGIATIDPITGVVTGDAPGTATITASAGGKTASTTVTVVNRTWKTGSYTMTYTSNNDGSEDNFNDGVSGIRVVFDNFERGGNNNNNRYKLMGTRTGNWNNYRYNDGQFVVSIQNSSLDGIKITGIEMTYTSNNYDNRTVTVTGDVSTTPQSSAGMSSWTSASSGDGNGDNTVTVTMACSNANEYGNNGDGRNRLTRVTIHYGYWE